MALDLLDIVVNGDALEILDIVVRGAPLLIHTQLGFDIPPPDDLARSLARQAPEPTDEIQTPTPPWIRDTGPYRQ